MGDFAGSGVDQHLAFACRVGQFDLIDHAVIFIVEREFLDPCAVLAFKFGQRFHQHIAGGASGAQFIFLEEAAEEAGELFFGLRDHLAGGGIDRDFVDSLAADKVNFIDQRIAFGFDLGFQHAAVDAALCGFDGLGHADALGLWGGFLGEERSGGDQERCGEGGELMWHGKPHEMCCGLPVPYWVTAFVVQRLAKRAVPWGRGSALIREEVVALGDCAGLVLAHVEKAREGRRVRFGVGVFR